MMDNHYTKNRAVRIKSSLLKSGALGVLLSVTALMSGCVSLGQKPPKQLFGLTAEKTAPSGSLSSAATSNSVLVLDPDADRRLDVLRIPVQVNETTIVYLEDVTWVERPARQFRRLLAETIRADNGNLVFEGGDGDIAPKVTLSGRLVDLGYDARTKSVVVRYDAVKEVRNGAITSRRFEVIVPDVAPKAGPVTAALNKAANDIAVQVAAWMR